MYPINNWIYEKEENNLPRRHGVTEEKKKRALRSCGFSLPLADKIRRMFYGRRVMPQLLR